MTASPWRPADPLADDLLQRWRQVGFDEAPFPELASEVLREHALHEVFDLDEALGGLLAAEEIPRQELPQDLGGLMTLTVARRPRLVVELLFWSEASMTVHDHTFAGAFQVVWGSSLHARYRFTEERRLSSQLRLGRTDLVSAERFARGAVQPVHSGPDYIHSLFHLDHPSVSLLVRTQRELATPPLRYLPPHFAADPLDRPQRVRKQVQALRLLHRLDPGRFLRALCQRVATDDFQPAFAILTEVVDLLADDGALAAVLDALATRHDPDRVRRVGETLDEEIRQLNLKQRRAAIRDPGHRFLLALLLNLPSREPILRMVAEIAPGAPPIDTVLQWLEELAEVPSLLPDEPNALGIELDEVTLLVLRGLLEGGDLPGILARLGEEYDPAEVAAQADDIAELCAALRESRTLRTLLA